MTKRRLDIELLETRELLARTVDIDLNDPMRVENAQEAGEYDNVEDPDGYENEQDDFIPVLIHQVNNFQNQIIFTLEHAQAVESKMIDHINSIYTLQRLTEKLRFETVAQLIAASENETSPDETIRFVPLLRLSCRNFNYGKSLRFVVSNCHLIC